MRANYGTFFMNKSFEIQDKYDLIFREPIIIVIVAIVIVAIAIVIVVGVMSGHRMYLAMCALRNGAAIAHWESACIP